MQEKSRPDVQDHLLIRSEGVELLHDQVPVNDAIARYSRGVQVGPFKHFSLYLRIKYTGSADTNMVWGLPQFLDPNSGLWHDYRQGIFASLTFEDTVHTTERDYIFTGDCVGREFRVQLLGDKALSTGNVPTSSNYYTVSAAVEFFN